MTSQQSDSEGVAWNIRLDEGNSTAEAVAVRMPKSARTLEHHRGSVSIRESNEGCGLDGKSQTGGGAYSSAPQSETNDGKVDSVREMLVSAAMTSESMAEAEDTTRAAKDS
ncbi:uncharacterized protein PITG_09570 [Phytophthora infestans T30-4]|uniref:Uncharacterized protein n=1 Tax=Phytophthora infestans (strain T30-4) TaxID=403677 RepID=D0NCA8_PHYIT|nr:uncharacterized protein PITG_09570 [Phytophthora infestans T30-4]EEY55622.1 hypothetical protein PITG_09570 [Phytophthora infestans T30-4]|eukprot:XP_002903198.1 hypothetical protein PITG_09570 [Phytophthora infestans T30-4]